MVWVLKMLDHLLNVFEKTNRFEVAFAVQRIVYSAKKETSLPVDAVDEHLLYAIAS